jgi:hypothetical protein
VTVPEPLFFVVGLDGSHGGVGPPYQACRIVDRWHLPYKKLYGPASRDACAEFIRKHCEGSDPAATPPTGQC